MKIKKAWLKFGAFNRKAGNWLDNLEKEYNKNQLEKTNQRIVQIRKQLELERAREELKQLQKSRTKKLDFGF